MWTALIVAAVVLSVTIWFIGRGRAEYRNVETALVDLNSMSLDEAEAKARAILEAKCRVEIGSEQAAEQTFPSELPSTVRTLFKSYPEINAWGVSISARNVRPSEMTPGYLAIGKGIEGEGDFEICVRPPADTVYELHRGEPIDSRYGTYSSIFHWVIACDGKLA